MTLNVSTDNPDIKILTPSFVLSPKEFITCETEIEGSGTVQIILQADCRFYLDNIMVKTDDTDAVETLKSDARYSIANGLFYDLSGQKIQNPSKGVYIINGKKVLK
jgi:hypothetical protein